MQSICVNYIACVSLNTNRRKNIFHTRHVGLWQNNKLKSLKVAQSKDDNYGWMMIFILDNIACLDEWVAFCFWCFAFEICGSVEIEKSEDDI